jgi:hypothetical protein
MQGRLGQANEWLCEKDHAGFGLSVTYAAAAPERFWIEKGLVPQTGLEPVTPSLRMTCSTN